jgi:hypothetical protein
MCVSESVRGKVAAFGGSVNGSQVDATVIQ